MQTATLILQIITIVISIYSIVTTFVLTTRENKKKHYLEIVTHQRLKNKTVVQNNAITLLTYSDENTVDLLNEERIVKCAEAVSAISAVLKKSYKEDLSVINSAEELLKAIKTKQKEEILAKREIFYKSYSTYDLADWRFIKSQASGLKKDSKEFNDIYEETNNQ